MRVVVTMIVPGNNYLNERISPAFALAGIAAVKEPSGLTRSDGRQCRHCDGMYVSPWQEGTYVDICTSMYVGIWHCLAI